jgi:hypothetical protein
MERVIRDPLQQQITSLRGEMLSNFDAVRKRFDRLESACRSRR